MNNSKQQGNSLVKGLLILILVGFFASIGFKVIPHYMDNKTLDKLITAVERDRPSVGQVRSPEDFYRHIEKGLNVNSVYSLKARDIMDVRAEGGTLYVRVKYEARENMLKNLDLVLNFDKEYRVRTQ